MTTAAENYIEIFDSNGLHEFAESGDVDIDVNQDWDNETTIYRFGDGSVIRDGRGELSLG